MKPGLFESGVIWIMLESIIFKYHLSTHPDLLN
jgi:hypothetical protein